MYRRFTSARVTSKFGGRGEWLKRMPETEFSALWKNYPLARWLYADFWISATGLFLTLVGLLLSMSIT